LPLDRGEVGKERGEGRLDQPYTLLWSHLGLPTGPPRRVDNYADRPWRPKQGLDREPLDPTSLHKRSTGESLDPEGPIRREEKGSRIKPSGSPTPARALPLGGT